MNIDALAEKNTVYALDLIGHGSSSKGVGDGSLEHLVASVIEFVRALRLENIHVIGHSLGGAIAIALADKHSDKIASLCCIAPVGLGDEVNPEFLDQYLNAERRRPVKSVLQMLVEDQSLVSGDMVENFQRYKRLEGSKEAMQKIADSNMKDGKQAHKLRDQLNNLISPRLIIWGDKDRVISPEHCKNLNDDVTIELIENAGHLPHLEKADDVNGLIKSHIG